MVFSSLIFIYGFLPIVLAGYYLTPKKFRNTFLFISSLIFFAWGGIFYSLILLFSLVLNYFIGLGIAKKSKKRFYLILGVTINLLILSIFKYAGFLIETSNAALKIFTFSPLKVPKILLPIGISFYTFQAISYLIDVYREDTLVQKKFINIGLFISLFPQLIAGPIVRYHDIAEQIIHRKSTINKFSEGVIRFVLGLGKKVLIANNMAIIADHVFSLSNDRLTISSAWIGIIAYSFQIYYDFSGYSDMAIGLGKMFGFDILENFNFPYIAKSIREFWRRWHISLSNWFRDYLYIPLGGNKVNKYRTYINLLIVFFITGLWHGASWNFVVWGLLHGFLMIIERLGFERILKKLPGIIQNTYALFFTIMAWVLFRANNFEHAFYYYKSLFNFNSHKMMDIKLIFELNNESFLFFVIAILGAFGFFPYLSKKIEYVTNKFEFSESTIILNKGILKILFVAIVLILCSAYLVNNSYNPFIYFRF
ncbi:MAG: MBOAT family protein [Chlorobi bacterium]|nr:MBOAT family protein [Chlorobiota bacterium]